MEENRFKVKGNKVTPIAENLTEPACLRPITFLVGFPLGWVSSVVFSLNVFLTEWVSYKVRISSYKELHLEKKIANGKQK